MAIEIEKKYLVFKDKLPELKNGVLYVQGYLCLSPLIRFRIIGNEVCLNIKKTKKNNQIRDEWEFFNSLNNKEIKELIKLSINKPILKIRHKIKYKNLIWEIDVYQGDNKGLITTEAELPNINYKILFPKWVDDRNEITNDQKYFNRNLGDHPFKSFKKKL